MKFFLLGLFLLWGNRTLASPFLVCDPYVANAEVGLNVVQFNISGLSANVINTAATINGDGTQSLHYDLALTPLANGKYTISVTATNGYGLTGDPATLVFTRGVPGPPSNLRISQN